MGGTAFELPVDVNREVFTTATVPKRSFWGRLLGLRAAPPAAGACGDMEIRIPELVARLRGDLRSFVEQAIPEPWAATRSLLRSYPYFLKPGISVYGARDGTGEPTAWHVGLRFPGCAGVAETSALLAVHWAEIWYQRTQPQIEQALRENRLRLSGPPSPWSDRGLAFLPVGELGYAFFNPDVDAEPDEEIGQTSHFEFDDSTAEAYGEKLSSALPAIEEQFAAAMGDGRCRCQMCMPDFDEAGVRKPHE